MKKLLVILCGICFASSTLAQKLDSVISPIKVLKTNFATETITGIDCDEFYYSFWDIDTFYISDKVV